MKKPAKQPKQPRLWVWVTLRRDSVGVWYIYDAEETKVFLCRDKSDRIKRVEVKP